MAKKEQKKWAPQDVAPGPLRCRGGGKGCGVDLRDVIAELLNEGTLQEDGVSVDYDCPACGAPHHVSRTAPAA